MQARNNTTDNYALLVTKMAQVEVVAGTAQLFTDCYKALVSEYVDGERDAFDYWADSDVDTEGIDTAAFKQRVLTAISNSMDVEHSKRKQKRLAKKAARAEIEAISDSLSRLFEALRKEYAYDKEGAVGKYLDSDDSDGINVEVFERRFCEAFGVDYDDDSDEEEEAGGSISPKVQSFLKTTWLEHYSEQLYAVGVEAVEDLSDIREDDLDSIGIKKIEIRRYLRAAPLWANGNE